MINKEIKFKEKINIFIPALALENFGNPVPATTQQKITRAIIRYYRFKDFNTFYMGPNPLPYVRIEKKLLKQNPLGYAVIAEIKSV